MEAGTTLPWVIDGAPDSTTETCTRRRGYTRSTVSPIRTTSSVPAFARYGYGATTHYLQIAPPPNEDGLERLCVLGAYSNQ